MFPASNKFSYSVANLQTKFWPSSESKTGSNMGQSSNLIRNMNIACVIAHKLVEMIWNIRDEIC